MKKVFAVILSLLACLLIFVACTDQDTTNIPNEESEPKLVAIEGGSISGQEIKLSVGKSIDNVFLFDLVKVTDNAIWKVIDINSNVITNKVVKLIDGNNIFYIEVSLPDGTKSTIYTLKVFKSYDVTITYEWQRDIQTLTRKQVRIEYGEIFTADYIPEINGYDFLGWHTYGSDEAFESTIATNDFTLYATISPKPVTVHLILDGQEWKTIDKLYAERIQLPIPEIEHYYLGDPSYGEDDRTWYCNDSYSDRTGTNYSDSHMNYQRDVYLYGRLVPCRYKITYDFGELYPYTRYSSQTVTYGEEFDIDIYPLCEIYIKGVKYKLSGFTYNEEPFEGGKYLYDGNITVEAVWIPESEYNQNN